ncbi:MAG: uracil-DNA glycosylase [Acidobacteriaceae bacterium]|nr:uracil-DNA glycosylase [Acidobacteriaceae bacterium]MBV9778722.1 uracil-DNA glycosylase [Acidobacteriaceae bacterium]
MTREQIRSQLELYRDLGVRFIYKRSPAVAPAQFEHKHGSVSVAADFAVLPSLAPDRDTLAKIRADIGDCRRCRLCAARQTVVFGSGNEQSKLVFVGEGPGAEEDEQGLPFVGRAGQLLTQMIDNTAAREGIPIRRADVYICNVVKCRPPDNRTPLPDEMEICGQFLVRQLMAIQPKAICVLGSTAMKALLNVKEGITKSRGKWHKWHGIPVMVTYHPSYLLRQYNQVAKREAWEDLRTLLHFVYD